MSAIRVSCARCGKDYRQTLDNEGPIYVAECACDLGLEKDRGAAADIRVRVRLGPPAFPPGDD